MPTKRGKRGSERGIFSPPIPQLIYLVFSVSLSNMSDFTEKVGKWIEVCDILVLEHHSMPCHRNHSESQVWSPWLVTDDVF